MLHSQTTTYAAPAPKADRHRATRIHQNPRPRFDGLTPPAPVRPADASPRAIAGPIPSAPKSRRAQEIIADPDFLKIATGLAKSYMFRLLAEVLPAHCPLQAECSHLGSYDRHSSTMAPLFAKMRDEVVAWLEKDAGVGA